MKNVLTLFCLLFALSVGLQAQERIIWGGPTDPAGSFDGGLNGWVTQGVSVGSGNPDDAVWKWSPFGVTPDTGAFAGNPAPIGSESASNGAVSFNSDWYDNGGNPATQGAGPVPGPHVSYLTSPAINTTGESEVFLKFNSDFRQNNAEAKVSILTNGNSFPDTTYIIFGVGTEPVRIIPVNQSTVNDNIEIIDISKWASNQSDVRIRFEWDGNYYFWVIDDVTLMTRPDNDLDVIESFLPAANGISPPCLGKYDLFGWNLDVVNRGTQAQSEVEAFVRVVEAVPGPNNDVVVFRDSVDVGSIAAGDTADIGFDELWAPDLPEGDYYVLYDIEQRETDINPTDNSTRTFGNFFSYKEDVFSKAQDTTPNFANSWGGIAGTNGESYSIAASYDIPNYENCTGDPTKTLKYYIKNIRHCHSDGGAPQANASVIFGLYEVDTTKLGSNYEILFDTRRGLDISDLSGNAGEFSLTGIYQDNVVLETGTFTMHHYSVEDAVNLENRELKPGSRYWVSVTYSSTLANLNSLDYFTCVDRNPPRQQPANQIFLFIDGGGGTGAWFFTQNALTLGMDLFVEVVDIVNTTNILPVNSVILSPNPVADQDLNIQFDFEVPTTGHITVYDETGRVSYMQEHRDVTNDQVSISTTDLISGTYFVLFQTDGGILTKQFVVQH